MRCPNIGSGVRRFVIQEGDKARGVGENMHGDGLSTSKAD